MYKCCECGRVFDKPIEMQEYSEFWGRPGYTPYYVSPCCHEAFDEYYEPDEDEEEELDDAV